MKYKFLLAASLFAAISAQAITTYGNPSCSKWVNAQAANGATRLMNLAWMSGFLSGIGVGAEIDALAGIDGDSAYLWIDNYCKANPLKTVGDAGTALFVELVDKKNLAPSK